MAGVGSLIDLIAIPLLLAAAGAVRAPAPAAPRVGIVVVDDDPAGGLQRDLEQAIRARVPNVTVRSAADLAALLTDPSLSPRPAGLSEADRAQAAGLIEEAKTAYYNETPVRSLDSLARLQALQEHAGNFPIAQRLELRLWKTAAFLALKDEGQASEEARAALGLDPGLQVDLKELPPSVGKQVELVRAGGLKVVQVTLNGVPPGGEIACDGRTVSAIFVTGAGHHKLVVWAPGRHVVTREFEGATNLSISLSLPLALPPEAEAAVAGLAGREDASPADAPLTELAGRLNLDWLIAVSAHASPTPALRAEIVSPAGSSWIGALLPRGPEAGATLRDGVIAALSARLPQNRPASEGGGGFSLAGNAGILTAGRQWSLQASSGGTVRAVFVGTGPAVALLASGHSVFAVAQVEYVSYAMSRVKVDLPGGSAPTATGGSTLSVQAGGGWEGALSNRGSDGPSLRAGLMLDVDQHSANDVSLPSGAPVGLFTSYLRIAPELQVGARIPFGSSALSAGAGAAPVGSWADSPQVDGPAKAIPAFAWSLAYAASLHHRWTLVARYDGELYGANYSGPTSIALTPAPTSPHIRESLQMITLSLTRGF